MAAAKTAVEFAKTNEKFVLIGGALGTQTLDAAGVRALAELPSLDALRARLVGMIQTPATRIAGVLQAPAGQLARVFGAYAKKDEAARTGRGRPKRLERMARPRWRAGWPTKPGLNGTNQSLD